MLANEKLFLEKLEDNFEFNLKFLLNGHHVFDFSEICRTELGSIRAIRLIRTS